MTVKAKYVLAGDAGYKFNLVKLGSSNYDLTAAYNKDNLPDVEVTRPGIETDLSKLHNRCLLSVNGYFYLTDYNVCIETDGTQHIIPVEKWGGMEALRETIIRDNIKNKYCEEKGINLIRIPYTDFDNIESILIENNQYVDGGIFANNPSMIAYTEAVDHFLNKTHAIDGQNFNYNGIHLLSIGLPDEPIGLPTGTKSRRSFLGWKDMLIKSAMAGTDYIANYQVDKLLNTTPNSKYYRINPQALSNKQLKHVRMDNSSKRAIRTLISYGQEAGDIYTSTKWNDIEAFFTNTKTYKF